MKLTISSVQHNLYFNGIKTHMHAHDSPFNKPSSGCVYESRKNFTRATDSHPQSRSQSVWNTHTIKYNNLQAQNLYTYSMQIKMMALNCSCTSYIKNYLVLLM